MIFDELRVRRATDTMIAVSPEQTEDFNYQKKAIEIMERRQTEKAFFPTYIQGNAKMIPFGYTV